MELTESEKALDTIHVPNKGLPKVEPQRSWAIEDRQRSIRNSRIYRDWLDAQDKEGEVLALAAKWGLTEGRINAIIERFQSGERSVVPFMAAELTVLKQVKREEVLNDGQAYRMEIDRQIIAYEQARENGCKWVEVEVMDEASEHPTTKTKKVSIDKVIRELYAELGKSHTTEADAIRAYIPQETQSLNVNLSANASKEFVEQFDKLRNLPKTKVVDAESEEVK